jgi:signal transduction histidine kinase
MEFMIKKEKDDYKIEIIDLEEIVEDRIDYFRKIATMNKRELLSNINSECQVEISQVELIRLIDNNISNAIKYSTPNSTIEISLKENELQFKNFGTLIKNHNKIFSKYYRENDVVGGYGLGLNIVKNIAKKYNIKFDVQIDEKNRNIFTYVFKSHFDDIQ